MDERTGVDWLCGRVDEVVDKRSGGRAEWQTNRQGRMMVDRFLKDKTCKLTR